MRTLTSTFIGLTLIGLASACSTNSVITGSWNNETTPHYSTMLVASITQSVETKSVIEKNLFSALGSKGVRITKSIDAFPPKISGNPSKDDM